MYVPPVETRRYHRLSSVSRSPSSQNLLSGTQQANKLDEYEEMVPRDFKSMVQVVDRKRGDENGTGGSDDDDDDRYGTDSPEVRQVKDDLRNEDRMLRRMEEEMPRSPYESMSAAIGMPGITVVTM